MAKRGYASKVDLAEVLHCLFYKSKPAVDGVRLLRFHDFVPVGHELHALQPFARVVVSVRAFRAVAHSRVFTTRRSCLVLSKNFNTMSAIFIHQPPTLPQKIDSREGLF